MRSTVSKLSKSTIKEDVMIEAQRLARRYDLVGSMMKEAMARGEFDHLEGAGQPLNLEENPFDPNNLHMAHKILKDAGYAPYWIELGRDINDLKKKFNREVEDFKKYTQIVFSEKRSGMAIRRYKQKRNKFYEQCRDDLKEISRKILDYNLHCPVSWLGRSNFDINDEMSSIIKDIENLPYTVRK